MGLLNFITKRRHAAQLNSVLDAIGKATFPNGDADIARDIEIVRSIVGNKIEDMKGFTIKCKTLVYVAKDKYDSKRFVESYMHYADDRITKDEAYNIYKTFMREYLETVM